MDGPVGGEHPVREDVEQRAFRDPARLRIERLRRPGAGVAHQQVDIAGTEHEVARDLVADDGQPGSPGTEHAVRIGLQLRHRQRRDAVRDRGQVGVTRRVIGSVHLSSSLL
jgi:hypothetical protein